MKFLPTGLVARKLRLGPRTLGRLVGTLPLTAGDERVDVGLNVKHGGKNLRVADAIQPGVDGKGWCYSPALISTLQQYQVGSLSEERRITKKQNMVVGCAWLHTVAERWRVDGMDVQAPMAQGLCCVLASSTEICSCLSWGAHLKTMPAACSARLLPDMLTFAWVSVTLCPPANRTLSFCPV